jgi:DNA-binding SARP family transcriptional activator
MTLKGDLDSISLADVFQTLSMTQQEGTLLVQCPDQRKHIFFSPKGVSLVTTAEKKLGRLGDLLVGLGKICQSDLEEALTLHKERGIRLGEALIEMDLVTQADIESAVRQQIEEEIYDLFSWENASFEFKEGAPEEGTFEQEGLPITKLTFNVNALIMEAARRIDEWDLIEKFIPTMKEIFIPDTSLDASGLSDGDQIVLGYLDGTRNVREVVQQSHVPKFDVCKFLYKLLEDGKASRVEFGYLIELGDDAVKGENLEDAIKFYEQAVEAKVKKRSDQMLARMRLAQALEYADRKKEAARHYKIIAEQKLEDDDLESAISIWHKVIEFDPLDLENKERLINLYLENRDRLDANKSDMIQQIELSLFKNGRSLAMAFSYAGQVERAKEVLNRLIELAPSNLELRKSLVNIFYDSGDKEGAVAELESIAQFLLAHRDYDNLLNIYGHMLKIDPTRTEVRRKIAMIEGGEMIQHEGRRWKLKLVVILLALVVLGGAGAVIFYQIQALQRWEKVQVEVDALWKKGERGKARELLVSLRRDLPYSLVGEKIDKKSLDFDQIEKAEKDRREFSLQSEIQKARGAYEDLVRVIRNSAASLDDEVLLNRLDEIREMMKENPYAEDLPEKLARERTWITLEVAKIQKLYNHAMDLERKAQTTGQYQSWLPEAWKAWLRLYEEGRRVPTLWEKVRLPVRVETIPPGAQAVVNGKTRYVTPFLFHKRPGEKIVVDLTRRGYRDEHIAFEVEDLSDHEPAAKFCFERRQMAIEQIFPSISFTGRLSTPPTMVGDTLFIATIVSGKVFAFHFDTDRLVTKLNGRRPSSHPLNYGFDTVGAVAEGRVFLGCQDGKVYTFDTRNDYAVTVYDSSIGRTGKIGVDGGGVAVDLVSRRIFLATTLGLYAFDLDDRKLLWSLPTPKPIHSTPLVHEGRVYFGCTDATFSAVAVDPPNLEGTKVPRPLWQLTLPAASTSEPVVRDNRLYIAAGDVLVEINLDAILPEDPSTWKVPCPLEVQRRRFPIAVAVEHLPLHYPWRIAFSRQQRGPFLLSQRANGDRQLV